MLGFVALFSLAAYLITPETAAGPDGDPLGFAFNLRYLAPALALALTVAPLAPALSATPPIRTGVVAALAILLAGTVAQPALWPNAHAAGAIAIGVAALAAAGLVAAGRQARVSLTIAVAAIGLVLVAGAAAGYRLQGHYLRGRYAYQPGVSYLAKVWALFRTVHDARVGVVGTFGGFFSYPLYGLDLSNRVAYVGQPGPHGSFAQVTTCARWRSQVNADHLKYIITTPARDPWHPSVLSASPETRWTATDPSATQVFSDARRGTADCRVPPHRSTRRCQLPTKLRVSCGYMSTTADPLTDPELLETEWDLGPLVDGEERAGAERMLDEAKERSSKFAATYAGNVTQLDGAGLQTAMQELETINDLIGRAGSYASLRFATDTADPERGALLQLVQERATEIETLLLFFDLEWSAIDDERAAELLAAGELDHYRHHLASVRRYRPHLLSESEEKILAEKSISSRAAWGRLFGELVSAVRVGLDDTT